MVLRTHRTGTKTATAATDSATLSEITGKIKQIVIYASASSNFKISYDIGGVTHYIMGSSGTTVIVNTTGVYYPVEVRCLADGVNLATAANIHAEIPLDGVNVDIAVSSLTAADTWAVEIVVEE